MHLPGQNKAMQSKCCWTFTRESVDEVMAQLFTLSCGVVRRQRSDDKIKPALLAVDHEIDASANAIADAGGVKSLMSEVRCQALYPRNNSE